MCRAVYKDSPLLYYHGGSSKVLTLSQWDGRVSEPETEVDAGIVIARPRESLRGSSLFFNDIVFTSVAILMSCSRLLHSRTV
jgi:hypothetical protein